MSGRGDTDDLPASPRARRWALIGFAFLFLVTLVVGDRLPSWLNAACTAAITAVLFGVPIYRGIKRGEITENSVLWFFKLSGALVFIYVAMFTALFAAFGVAMVLSRAL